MSADPRRLPRNFYFDQRRSRNGSRSASLRQDAARAGAEVVEVAVEHAEDAHQAARLFIYADACALHARELDERRSDISPAVYERMIQAETVTARNMRKRAIPRDVAAFSAVSSSASTCCLPPATPYTAGPIDDGTTLHEATRHATRFAYGGGLAGIPGLALPCGFSAEGMPIGAQLEAAWGAKTAHPCGFELAAHDRLASSPATGRMK